MSTPTIPQRPSRSSHPPVSLEEPKVPPRPTRKFERSLSRDRENYARSPLNESPFQTPDSTNAAQRPANLGALRRPPSVASLPLIGQEGSEYASLEEAQANADTSNSDGLTVPTATSNVSSDLPLHAPKASAGPATTSRLAEVTRTGSAAADSSGYGSVPSSRPLSVSQERPASSISRERPGSAADHRPWETDIPEIGVRVPMYPNAGDVQAPTPGPGSATPSSGVGFFNNASSRPVTAGSTSGRRKSAQFQVPAGSYGLHGHGVGPQDQFEKSWYQRHPEELNKEEHGYHGPAAAVERHDWNMSSEQLNKLVRDSGRRQNVMGGATEGVSTPTEQIGYMATEQYASRSNSPRPISVHKTTSHGLSRTGSATHAESPLRMSSFADAAFASQNAVESDADDDDRVHVDAPVRRMNKWSGTNNDQPFIDLGPRGGNTSRHGGWIQEDGPGTPILASDEIAKNPQEWLMPAVSPEAEKHSHDEEYFSGYDERGLPKYERGYRSHSRSRSRNEGSSRPSSLHGASGLSRFISHEEGAGTPLEEIEEFEPLFEEDDSQPIKKPKTAADRLKRPELEHRFPSQDIWEDTPDSLRLETTVDTPEEPAPAKTSKSAPASAIFETPEQEAIRKGGQALPKPKLNPALAAEVATSRPGLRQRFPSSDIWEDTPDSQLFTTTVGDEQQSREVTTAPVRSAKAQPSIPPRPSGLSKQTSPTERKGPVIPDRPKPKLSERSIEPEAPSEADAAIPKVKPAVPARPAGVGAKFASIKSSFMNDLNSRLQLGPKPPPKAEEPSSDIREEEALPLSDARKSRARGPVRRKPATSPSAGESLPATFSILSPISVWSISPRNGLVVDALSTQTKSSPDATIAQDVSKVAQVSTFEEQRIGHVGDVPNPVPSTAALSAAPILATDAHEEQVAASSSPAISEKRSQNELPLPRKDLDHRDTATPDLLDAAAEAERQAELAKLPVAANILSSGETFNANATVADGKKDISVQTGEQRLSDETIDEEGSKGNVTITLGGNAKTGENVISGQQ